MAKNTKTTHGVGSDQGGGSKAPAKTALLLAVRNPKRPLSRVSLYLRGAAETSRLSCTAVADISRNITP